MVNIQPLQPGDQIALVCTGSVCDSKQEAIACSDYLKKHFNLNVISGQDLYLPLPAKVRADILLSYVLDDKVKAIWSARGGEGTADVIPYVAARAHQIRQAKPKLLLGFSDYTALLLYFAQTFQWPVMHSLSARQLPRGSVDAGSEEATKQWLFATSHSLEFNLTPINRAAFSSGVISAPITGGNLSLLQLSLRDSWELQPKNKILLIEEVNEQPYQIARMLKHLQRIDSLEQVRAIIFAGCDFPGQVKSKLPEVQRRMRKMLGEFAREVSVPVLYTPVVGHGQANHPLPFNIMADLKLAAGKASLSISR